MNILGVPFQISGADTIKINEIVSELTAEIYKALSDTGYIGKNMKNESDILLMNDIIRDLGYTGREDRDSKRKTFFTKTLPKLVEEIENKIFDKITEGSDDLQEGVKFIIPSNIIDIYTRLEVLLGLKLSGHTDTLTELSTSNLIDELYKRGEIQNQQQYRNALDKFSTNSMELPSKLLAQIAYNTAPEIEELILIVMDKCTHEEHLSQSLQTNNKKFKIAVTFSTGYNGIFNLTPNNNKFCFKKTITDEDGFIRITIPRALTKLNH